MPSVGSLNRNQPRITPYLPIKISVSYIYGIYSLSVALKQDIRKSPGCCANISADKPSNIDCKMVKRPLKLPGTSTHKALRCNY
jgi:hypothetical protein